MGSVGLDRLRKGGMKGMMGGMPGMMNMMMDPWGASELKQSHYARGGWGWGGKGSSGPYGYESWDGKGKGKAKGGRAVPCMR